jgi:NADPH:quinone reductase-like Zn-dependent oxidoreductase
MLAAGLHHVVFSRSKGQHYSASKLPHPVGIDGVGIEEATGKLYFVNSFAPDFGSYADYVNVDKSVTTQVPDGADPVAMAAFANPGMSSWMALRTRTANLPGGFTCLILGVTSASGELAVQIAKALGAGKVIGVARNEKAMKEIHGLDESIVLKNPVSQTDFSAVDCDVVLDYIYGDAAAHLLSTIRTPRPVQYVQIGTISNQPEINLPAAFLRSKNMTIRGSGPGAWSLEELAKELEPMVSKLSQLKLTEPVKIKLEDIEKVWDDKELWGKKRVVFIP